MTSTAIVKPQNSSLLKKPFTSYHIGQPITFKSWTPISTSFSVSCVMTDNQSKVVVVVDHDKPAVHLRPDSLGRFGKFGGKYVPETLMYALSELESAFNALSSDCDFQEELNSILKDYVGRESPLYFAESLPEGPEVYLKREDLNHTGAHKINNAVAQALLAKKLGKERIIAETGAGQHGVATATVCARFGLQCIIYMGAQDMERQALNAFRMKLLGAEVRPVHSGTATLKDATSEAIRDWVTNVETTHYILGSVAGPHPYPMMVREFHAVIGKETRKQALEKWGGKPDVLVACVGRGSNAIGLFHEFVDDKDVRLIGVEAAGFGLDSGKHAATLTKGEVGVMHGAMSYLLQDDDGQIIEPHSISAGLDYPGVGPEHSFLKDLGRAECYSITDEDLNHTGAHKVNNAVAQALLAKKLGKERIIAETGAGQHGVATATVCARFGLQCIIYMGAQDMERQALNVFRMKLLGAEANDKHKAGPVIYSHGMESCLGYRTTNTSLKTAARKLYNEAGTTPHCVVLDIGGTTTPKSFFTDVLYPYSRENVCMHIVETYDSDDTKDDIEMLRSQVDDDLQNGVVGAVPVPSDDAGKEEVIDALVANFEGIIKAGRKITLLKPLEGHIWRTGFQKNELKGVVYDDVPEALERWHASGVKVYIYSSGSRLAQRLIFGYTNYGDLRQYLCGFFDTKMGNKKETKSYIDISESLGVDNPSEVLFVTDVYQEAVAAKAAGLEVIISIRPGNGPLPENHGFDTIKSFSEIPF